MIARTFACIFAVVLLTEAAAFGQSFELADVHVSPREAWVKKTTNAMQSGFPAPGRFELRRATMLDLIKFAYAVDGDKVYGGPGWLDYDRFDVIVKTSATRPEQIRPMLQSLLAERFKLTVQKDTKPAPAYLLSKGNGEPKLKPADGSVPSGCQSGLPAIRDNVPYASLQCHNTTMGAFAAALRQSASGAFNGLPVVDSTGIDGAFDIDLQYPLRVISLGAGGGAAASSGGSVFEAVEKQLGLKVELSKSPQPVLVVESVNEQPTPNAPEVAAGLPSLPPPQFEVASLRPCQRGPIQRGPMTIAPRFERGGQVTAACMPLLSLIRQAWNLAPFEKLEGAPKWLESDPGSYNITAKTPAGMFSDAQGIGGYQDVINAMLRALLTDRFQVAVHYEDRLMDAYTLAAPKSSSSIKLTKADPSNRTGCTRQNPTGGSALALRLVCQNITIAQFAEQMQAFDSQIFYPVLDETGIQGAWDFTLSYNVILNLPPVLAARAGGAAAPGVPSDPSGAISFTEAVEKQLGLKLETHRRTERVLVIDHMEQKPAEN
ncbi:MAG TPA: TIGR03435 family protein [Bryobacteraceae bacterium]|jgi:uncharacterized protein (TIGR03435 family)